MSYGSIGTGQQRDPGCIEAEHFLEASRKLLKTLEDLGDEWEGDDDDDDEEEGKRRDPNQPKTPSREQLMAQIARETSAVYQAWRLRLSLKLGG